MLDKKSRRSGNEFTEIIYTFNNTNKAGIAHYVTACSNSAKRSAISHSVSFPEIIQYLLGY